MNNRVMNKIRAGELALGAYVSFTDPQIVEIIGLAGFDAAFIDMEHTAFDLPLIQQMIVAADLVGITPMVRVPDNDSKLILRLLDMGTQGIIIPHVNGVEGAREAVSAVRYPPLGERGGAGGTRAARFGTVSWDEHVRTSNDSILLSVMTEDAKALDEVDQIAALDGVDLVAIGPTDLSQAIGASGPSDPRLMDKVREVADVVKAVGKAKLQIPINHAALPLGPRDLMELGVGYTHVAPPPPSVLLNDMMRRVSEIQGEIG